jgi:hypothetical protein
VGLSCDTSLEDLYQAYQDDRFRSLTTSRSMLADCMMARAFRDLHHLFSVVYHSETYLCVSSAVLVENMIRSMATFCFVTWHPVKLRRPPHHPDVSLRNGSIFPTQPNTFEVICYWFSLWKRIYSPPGRSSKQLTGIGPTVFSNRAPCFSQLV